MNKIENYRIYHFFGRPILAVLENPAQIHLMAWECYHGFTFKRAIFRWLMQCAISTRTDRIFSRVATSPLKDNESFRFQAWIEQVQEELACPAIQPVIIWPRQTDRGRVYVYLLSTGGQPIGFCKVSFDDHNDECLCREVRALYDLNAQHLTKCNIPIVLVNGFWQGHKYIIESPLKMNAWPLYSIPEAYPRSCAEEFGGSPRMVAPSKVESFSWWRCLTEIAQDSFKPFLGRLSDLIYSCSGLLVRRVHGDFGPHNFITQNNQLWVLDWEESSDNGPALTDQIGYYLSVNAKAVRRRPRAVLRNFAVRYLRGASHEKLRDVMAALAFRKNVVALDTDIYIRNWDYLTKSGEL